MNDDISKRKELVINNVLYAHYLFEKGVLFLKSRKDIIRGDKRKSEDFLVQIISLIEKKKMPYVAYLNIK